MYTKERIRMYGKHLRIGELHCDPQTMDIFEACHPNYSPKLWSKRIPFGKGKTYADEEGTVVKGREWTL
jgi:hypothetical protein